MPHMRSALISAQQLIPSLFLPVKISVGAFHAPRRESHLEMYLLLTRNVANGLLDHLLQEAEALSRSPRVAMMILRAVKKVASGCLILNRRNASRSVCIPSVYRMIFQAPGQEVIQLNLLTSVWTLNQRTAFNRVKMKADQRSFAVGVRA